MNFGYHEVNPFPNAGADPAESPGSTSEKTIDEPRDDALHYVGDAFMHETFGSNPDGATYVEQEDGSYLLVTETQKSTKESVTLRQRFVDKYNDIADRFDWVRATSDVVGGLREDLTEQDNKLVAPALIGATALTQFIDRSRLVLIFGPQIALETAEHTNSSLLGGMAVASIFAVSNFTVGETLTQTMDRFPHAKDAFKAGFPKTLRVFKDSLAGIESQELAEETESSESTDDTHKVERIRAKIKLAGLDASQTLADTFNSFESPEEKLARDAWAVQEAQKLEKIIGNSKGDGLIVGLKRAGTGIGLGSTAFVATSSTEGHDKATVRSINYKVTRDTGILITAIGTGVIESIKRMYMQGWYDVAKRVDDIVSDGRTWLGVAGLSIVSTFISNRIAYKKLNKETSETEQPQASSD